MGALALNHKNVFFVADYKLFSFGRVRLHAEGDLQDRRTPRAVSTPVLRHERFRHISANIGSKIENVCVISQGLHAAVFTWGDNYGSQQGTLFVMPAVSAADSASESSSYSESGSWYDGRSDDAQAHEEQEQQEVPAEQPQQVPAEEQQQVPAEEQQQVPGEEQQQVPGEEQQVRVGEIYSSNPVRRGREHFHGETPALGASSARSFFVVTESGNLWCVGDDSLARNLVHPDNPLQTFARVPRELFQGIDVVSLSIGQAHILTVCADGSVYGWGRNNYGALGVNDDEVTDRSHPEKIDSTAWDHRRIIAVSAGDNHSNALSHDGVVWQWGIIHSDTEKDPNSTTVTYHYHETPVRVRSNEVPFDDTTFQSVCCGSTFTLMLSTQGHIWSCGSGEHGELGLGWQTSAPHTMRPLTSRHPMRIEELDNNPMYSGMLTDFGYADDPVVSISCGVKNCGAISHSGRVHVWGAKYVPDEAWDVQDFIRTPRLIMSRHQFPAAASMAFSMAQQPRLGESSPAHQLSTEMYHMALRPDMES